MLNAAVLTPQRASYLADQVAASRDDYYTGRGETAGEWFGEAAASLGLVGAVAHGALERLVQGLHPTDDRVLRTPVAPREVRVRALDAAGEPVTHARILRPVGGFDFVFSAPKSISLAHALGSTAVRRDVLAAHHAAVHATLRMLERDTAFVRLGAQGRRRERALGIVAALYTHRTSRALDPHLHTHVAIGNLAPCSDGEWRTLDSRTLLRDWKLALGHVYQAHLRHEITTRLGWRWREPLKGLAELAGWDASALRAMSQRRQQLEAHLPATAGWRDAQQAAWSTRDRKTRDVDYQFLRDDWRARLAEHGIQSRVLERLLEPGEATAGSPDTARIELEVQRLCGSDGLTEKRNTFHRADAVRAIADAYPAGLTAERISDQVDYLLSRTDLVLRASQPDRWTTRDLVAIEQRLLQMVSDGRDTDCGVLPHESLERSITCAPMSLTHDQIQVIRSVATSGHSIENIDAVAGSGKTALAGVLADAYRIAGYTVIGATPTARAARELERVGIAAFTIARLDLSLQHTPRPERPILVIADENGMSGTREWLRVVERLREWNAKIVQIGDSGQLPGVPASGAFQYLNTQHLAEQLEHVVRQHDADEVGALDALRRGDPGEYLAHKLRSGDLTIAEHADAATKEALDWRRGLPARQRAESAIIVRRSQLCDELNRAVRDDRLAHGELSGPTLIAANRPFACGDRILTRRNDARIGIDNGTRGTVTAISRLWREVEITTDDQRRLRIPSTYLDAGHVEHAYALTAHAMQGTTIEHALIVSTPDDHSREWSYTASSRSRQPARHVLIATAPDTQRETGDERTIDAVDAITRTAERMRRRECEPLATSQLEFGDGHDPACRMHENRERAL
jgi:conjugative relaxase-like TrwC/TraI family protein